MISILLYLSIFIVSTFTIMNQIIIYFSVLKFPFKLAMVDVKFESLAIQQRLYIMIDSKMVGEIESKMLIRFLFFKIFHNFIV
jgi:hypothetical protein